MDAPEAEVLTEYFEYLDELRDSGVTNMFGASPYLSREFDLSVQDARTVLSKWQLTFSRSETPHFRAVLALDDWESA